MAGLVDVAVTSPSHLVTAPDYTLYAGISLKFYLLIFFATIGIHVFVIFVTKTIFCKSFWSKLSFLEKIIHSLENTNIAYNIKEWDDGKGDAKEHRKRMQSNWYEVLAIIIINGFFNLLHLVPLCFLGKNEETIHQMFQFNNRSMFSVFKMQERHTVLAETIGYLQEEKDAIYRGHVLLIGSLVFIFISTILQVIFFWLYNGTCHPFANILVISSQNSKSKLE